MVDDEQPRPAAAGRPRPRPVVELPVVAEVEPDPDPEPTVRPAGSGPAHAQARPRRPRRRAGLLVLAAIVVAAAVAIAVVVVRGSGDSGSSASASASATNDATAAVTHGDVANAFVAAATTDIVAVTTYDYRSLDTALSNGEPVTTGAYRASFRAALTGPLAAEARRVHRVQTFALLDAGIGEIAANSRSAKVLIFGVQSVTDATTGGAARKTLVTLTATLQRQGSRYLVAQLAAGQNAGLPAGTAGLRAAAEAGREQVVDVLSLRHDHFDADYNRALAGAVDPLRASLTSQLATTRKQVTSGGYDLAGTVTAVGVERVAGDTVVMLVAATGTRTTSAGKTTTVVDGRYRVTVVYVSGVWVTSAIDAVVAR